ncbi:hypothetical protein DFJ73DRAFT_229150 [Zopfochytrium polystomum]|nr:hypothetical protein DFJ73DRAFT_229150 [Zopfochytrium polystomum]
MAAQPGVDLSGYRSTLFLTFSPKSLPYAELAAFNLAEVGTAASIKLGLHRDLHSSVVSLTVPAGPHTTERFTLEGKASISRFIARIFPGAGGLYTSLSLEKQALVDEFLDLARAVVAGTVKPVEVLNRIKAGSPVLSKKPSSKNLTLADLVAWDVARQHPDLVPDADRWAAGVQSVPEVKQAFEQIRKTLVKTHLLDEYRFAITNELARVTCVATDTIFPLVENKWPKDASGCDFILAAPRLRLPGAPAEVAKDVASKFKKDDSLAEVKADGVFIKFFVNWPSFRNKLIPKVLELGEEYGTNASGFGKLAIVEFSSPNIAKPFHVGHIRSTIIGNFIQNTLQANGWNTTSINYLGDWGKQYGLLAIGFARHGSEEKLVADPIRHLYDVYVQINREAEVEETIHDEARAYFKKMEEGDTESLGLWQRFRDLSIIKYREIYGRFHVHFDEYSGESRYSALQMRGVVDKLEEMGLLSDMEGSRAVDLKEYKLGMAVIEKRGAGGMLYISRDVAAAIHRQKEYKFDNMYYVVGSQQEHHFKQLFKVLELMGMPWAERCEHISFGMIKTKDGNMSSRKGTVVFLEDILNQVQESMLEVMKKNEVKFRQIQEPNQVADLVGLTAVMIQDMSSRRVKDYELDWDRMLAFEGDTGPYLQYAHARLRSIERTVNLDVGPDVDLTVLTEPSAVALLDVMAMYPDVVRDVAISLEPCNTVSFAFRLAHVVMVALENLYVLNQPPEIARARFAMFKAARITLGNALRSLGVLPLERM